MLKSKGLQTLLLLLCGSALGGATTLTVGPSGQYPDPCSAISAAGDGDTILVEANNGTPYMVGGDCTVRPSYLKILGIHGRPILDAADVQISKGILVLNGHDITIDNFEFRNAHGGPDSINAAGIRIQDSNGAVDGTPAGGNITVRHCYFHDNGDGVLGANADANNVWYSPNPFLTFEYNEFRHNGAGDGSTHNIYMGYGGNLTFTFRYNWSHDANNGHTLKTRAPINVIKYNLLTDEYGESNYLLDFCLGGTAYVVGNALYKGPTNGNNNQATMIFADRTDNTPSDPEYDTNHQDLHFINNTVVVDPSNGFPPQFVSVSCFNSDSSTCAPPNNGPVETVPAVIENNIFVGPAGDNVTNQETAHVSNNLVLPYTATTLTSLFVDPAHFNYRLRSAPRN